MELCGSKLMSMLGILLELARIVEFKLLPHISPRMQMMLWTWSNVCQVRRGYHLLVGFRSFFHDTCVAFVSLAGVLLEQ